MVQVILLPNSETNPSDYHRIVDFDKWRAYIDGEVSYLPVISEHNSYAEAEASLNN